MWTDVLRFIAENEEVGGGDGQSSDVIKLNRTQGEGIGGLKGIN